MIDVLVMTDGRDAELAVTLESLARHVTGPIDRVWLHDDTGDEPHRGRLEHDPRGYRVIGRGPRRGFGGAITHAWGVVADCTRARFLFHVEGDFEFRRPVDLAAMAAVLDRHPYLVQMALRRQAWSAAERAAGGVVEQRAAEYVDASWPAARSPGADGVEWLEHRLFFTTNPSLIPMWLVRQGWPTGPQSEGRFAMHLFGNSPDARAGYWGARTDPPWVEHIGHQRIGTGY